MCPREMNGIEILVHQHQDLPSLREVCTVQKNLVTQHQGLIELELQSNFFLNSKVTFISGKHVKKHDLNIFSHYYSVSALFSVKGQELWI